MKTHSEWLKELTETLNNSKDISGALGVMEVEHRYIHEGQHYFFDDVIELGALGVLNIILETNEKAPNFIFEVSSTVSGFVYESYEAVEANDDGTEKIALNNNRRSENTAHMTIKYDPTGINVTNSTLLRRLRAGTAGGVGNARLGNIERNTEIIFKPETKYLLRITNLGNATNYIDIKMNWYEV